jgi:nucleoside-diphosphate-sugar epimerase
VLAQEPAAFAARLASVSGQLERLDANLHDPAAEEVIAAFGPELVFHLAGRTDQSRGRDIEHLQFAEHLGAAQAVVRACFRPGLRRLIYTSSNEEYGHNPVPHREDQREMPISAYSAAKAACTHYFQMLGRSEQLPIVIVRPFLVYGPGQGRGLIHLVGRPALRQEPFDCTEGSQTRDFVYVSDVVDGLLSAASVPGLEGGIYNLGTGVETRVRDVIEMVTRLAGGRPRFGALPTRPGEMMRSVADTTSSRERLGWTARTPLADGLAATLEDLRRGLRDTIDA